MRTVRNVVLARDTRKFFGVTGPMKIACTCTKAGFQRRFSAIDVRYSLCMNMQYQNRTARAAFEDTYENIEIIALSLE